MECPFCQSSETKVLESRSAEDNRSIRRRRECEACEKRFTTFEKFEMARMIVNKRCGKRELYSRDKVIESIVRCSNKSHLSTEEIDKLADRIESRMYQDFNRELNSTDIGEIIMCELKKSDPLAFLRYASIFKDFTTVGEFINELGDLQQNCKETRVNELEKLLLQ